MEGLGEEETWSLLPRPEVHPVTGDPTIPHEQEESYGWTHGMLMLMFNIPLHLRCIFLPCYLDLGILRILNPNIVSSQVLNMRVTSTTPNNQPSEST